MAKLVLYKPVKPLKGKGVMAAHCQKSLAINQSGVISNSIGKIILEMKSVAGATVAFQKYQEKKQKKLARLEKDRVAENVQEGKIAPENPQGNINEGKDADLKDTKTTKAAEGWLEKIFGPYGNFLQDLITLVITKAVFDFMKNPKNWKTVQWAVETTGKVFKFFAGWVKGSVEKLLGGMGQMFDPNATFWERIKGFGNMLLGILGLSALMNPFGLISGIMTLATGLVDWVKSVIRWWKKKKKQALDQVTDTLTDTGKKTAKAVDKADDAKTVAKAVDKVDDAAGVGKTTSKSGGLMGWIGEQKKKISQVSDDLMSGKLWGKMGKGLSDWGKNLYKNLPDGIKKNWETIAEVGSKVTKNAISEGNKWGGKMMGWFGDAKKWIGDGIASNMKKVGQAAQDWVIKPVKEMFAPLMKKLKPMADGVQAALFDTPLGKKVAAWLKKSGLFPPLSNIKPLSKKIGGKALPVVGGVVNLGFAYDRFQQGDPIGGAFEALSAAFDIMGLIPGGQFGPTVSMIIDAYMLARDFIPGIQEGEEKIIEKLGAKGIVEQVKTFGSKLPPIGDIIKFLTGKGDQIKPREPDGKGDTNQPGGEVTDSWDVNEDNVISGDNFMGEGDDWGGGEEFSQGGPFTRIPEMASGGELTSMSELNALEDDEDATPFAFPIVSATPIYMPMPINSSQEVIQGTRSPLLDKV